MIAIQGVVVSLKAMSDTNDHDIFSSVNNCLANAIAQIPKVIIVRVLLYFAKSAFVTIKRRMAQLK
jgi:hypothetical protein